MPQCPQCSKPLVSLARQCPSCRADLDLLVDYVNGLQINLARAEQLTRNGDLGQAMWAYLEVLELDPDNAEARQQVGQIATAVRQFDRTAPGRRWSQGLSPIPPSTGSLGWLKPAILALVVVFAFGLGFLVARSIEPNITPASPTPTPKTTDKKNEIPNLRKDPQLGL
jgi:hypothetical protein